MLMPDLKEFLQEAFEKEYRITVAVVAGMYYKRYIHHVGDDYVALTKKPGKMYEEIVPIRWIAKITINERPEDR